MATVMPRVRQTPTPNYTPSPIAHDLVVVHMMEGGYLGSVAWLCDPRAGASAHLCMSEDGAEATQLVPLSLKAWAQCAFNGRGVSLEIPGFTAQGVPEARWPRGGADRSLALPGLRHPSGLGEGGAGPRSLPAPTISGWPAAAMLIAPASGRRRGSRSWGS